MKNPWEEIKLSDYENHMSLSTVMQLQSMNKIMESQFYSYPAKTVMIMGVAGGNGLEHIDPQKFDRVYGIDVNKEYLLECEKRYPQLNSVMEYLCVDLTDENAVLPDVDLVIANLLIEYIGYNCFKRSIDKIKPQYVSCVIQINTDDGFVSDSPYLHVFDILDSVHNQMEEEALINALNDIDYYKISSEEQILPNGKKLLRLDFEFMKDKLYEKNLAE